MGRWVLVCCAFCALIRVGSAAVITFSGTITQSTTDGTGPAVNNPQLNSIQDGDTFSVTLTIPGVVTGPGTYFPTSVLFNDPAAGTNESNFGTNTLIITANGLFYDFSLLACLTTGTDCFAGNQLDGNFRISVASIGLSGVSATGQDPPHPLDLLEDDGTTDIQGTIALYSCDGCTVSAAPEVSTFGLVAVGLAVSLLLRRVRAFMKEVRRIP